MDGKPKGGKDLPTAEESLTFRDKRGFTSQVRFFVTDADAPSMLTDAQAIATDMAAMSAASLNAAHGAYNTAPSPPTYPTPAATERYQDVEDKAVLTYVTASGSYHRYKIPCPLVALFLADDKTMDPANASLVTLNGAVIGKASARNGELISAFIGGIRTRVKIRRRLNINVLSPTDSGPGL